ncbi:MAG: helix-turn-helix domain-containing protein [Pseudomonadota bacterium]
MITLKIKNARDLGLAIKERRIAAGLDQGALAVKIGVSRLWVNEIEKGKPRAAVGLVLKALNVLDIAFQIDDGEAHSSDAIDMIDLDAVVDSAKEER